MADHNGDYSPEAEHTRQLKREKMQRRRIRQRIDEGRATDNERVAMALWDEGTHAWEEIAAALSAEKADMPAPSPRAAARPPRKTRAAVPRRDAPEEKPEETGIGWLGWAALGSVAVIFVAAILRG